MDCSRRVSYRRVSQKSSRPWGGVRNPLSTLAFIEMAVVPKPKLNLQCGVKSIPNLPAGVVSQPLVPSRGSCVPQSCISATCRLVLE